MAVDLRALPFCLDDEQAAWVESTWENMTLEEKIGQLFCGAVGGLDDASIHGLTDLNFGGFMVRAIPGAYLRDGVNRAQAASKLPLLISANLETGGDGAVSEGTLFASPMGATATGDMENGYRLGKISTAEAHECGIRWGYAPIIDIDRCYHNPITNIRSFSSHPEEVLAMARGYLRAAKEEGVLPTIKHFPGDGTDERDQHLLVSVNRMDADEWMATSGHIYGTLIAEGAPTVMIGHIAQPAMARLVNPDITPAEAMYPASLSKTLITGVLREKLGFNGLAITDSTLMVGYMQKVPRKVALPMSIEAGIDMILFNRNAKEDFDYMMEGYKEGRLSDERLHDAVFRILAAKAMLNLHKDRTVPEPETSVIGCEQFKAWTKEAADKAITLVKNNGRIALPLSPETHRRIYLNVIENEANDSSPFAAEMKERFEKEGFEVTLRQRELHINMEDMLSGKMSPDAMRIMGEIRATTEQFVSQYDMAVIILNMPTMSNATVVRVAWSVFAGMGNDIPWYAGEMPLVVASFCNPYHLLDIPMADIYVNAYTCNADTKDAVFDKLMGRSEFKGISPVDAFCGHEDCMV